MHALVTAAVVLVLFMKNAQSIKEFEWEQNTLDKIFQNYNAAIRPAGENGTGPVKVIVNTFIRSITNVDENKRTFDTQLTFRLQWKDKRLIHQKNDDIPYLTLTQTEKIWIPDIFFSNEMEGKFHNIIKPNTLLRIYADGAVLFSSRISLRLSSPMDLRNYPMDNQKLSIVFASYGYTTRDIVFDWKLDNPIQVTKNLDLPKFIYKGLDYGGECTARTNTGEYSCLNLHLFFSRNFFYYLQSAYMPTTALVLFSWVVFWLNPKYSTVRFGIWAAMLISIIIVNTSILFMAPEVSYTKAIDVWLGMCTCFIFGVLVELCAVNNFCPNDDTSGFQDQLQVDDMTADKNLIIADEKGKLSHFHRYLSAPLRRLRRYPTKAQKIDAASRVLFPVVFVIFNFIYWITYSAKRN